MASCCSGPVLRLYQKGQALLGLDNADISHLESIARAWHCIAIVQLATIIIVPDGGSQTSCFNWCHLIHALLDHQWQ